MNILVVNDDGYNAPGIAALVRELRKKHNVFVCAPKENQSAVGHGLTIRRLLHAEQVTTFDKAADGEETKPVAAFCVDGTPADCVRVAVGNLGANPDVVISGINQAPNLGTDVLYSGTVSAAEEAAMIGYRAVAVSKDTFGTDYFEDAAAHFCSNLDLFLRCINEEHRLLNVNYPNLPANEYKGIRAGHLAQQIYPITYTETTDEDGRTGYRTPSNKLTDCGEHDTTDEKFVRDGFIAVTPLKYDVTDYQRLEQIAAIAEKTY